MLILHNQSSFRLATRILTPTGLSILHQPENEKDAIAEYAALAYAMG